jgi:endonuclease/exonuclease/phosphatase family metal-dependent hydrolase
MINRRGRKGIRRDRQGNALCFALRKPQRSLRFFIAVMLIGLASVPVFSQTPLLESGRAENLVAPAAASEIKVISYNIRWRSGEELQQIIRWVKDGTGSTPAIVGLQEVDRAKQRSGRANHAKALANALRMYYAWAAPSSVATNNKENEEEETGVEILSPYPLMDIARIVLPNAGPAGRQRIAVAATMTIGKTSVRVYSVHSETRLTIAKKIDQLRAVLNDLDRFPKAMPAIVLGDFNTWELPSVAGVRKLFTEAGFTTPVPDDESTFYRKALMFDVKLKLDWIWLRGFTPKSYGIDRSLIVSDHFPLWTIVKLTE